MTIQEGPTPKWESKLYEYQHPLTDQRTGYQLQRLREREQNLQMRKNWRKRRDRLLRWKTRAEVAIKKGEPAVQVYVPHTEEDLQKAGKLLKQHQKSQHREIPAAHLLDWIARQYTRPSA